jgi:hypothetical protein
MYDGRTPHSHSHGVYIPPTHELYYTPRALTKIGDKLEECLALIVLFEREVVGLS